jgi:UDP-N-acetylglucosamine 2-epimerase (non-hydrolysing)
MKRYLILIGTRPEAIKMCPLILALRRRPSVRVRVVLTGQHADMVEGVLRFFGVEADADLGVMHAGQTPVRVRLPVPKNSLHETVRFHAGNTPG